MENKNISISVVVVNYNVEYFLEQCLNSVFDALKGIEGEVFVVDNNSIDGSVAMVKERFKEVKLIENKDNVGFSKANNQAMEVAKGRYILLLNPDTVVEEDTFRKCIDFMDQHPEGGGLGVHMIDGKGNFLPESKRGLPTPAVAFYKIFGFSRLFPKNKTFGKYHLGFLDEFETNEVEILSGAFMFMRKEALDKVGLLDEAFFMYGEDIDLSYRIIKGGYKNYYFPKTQIIHYKGESTKKSSINYVFVFYRAMVIFAEKHFSQKNAKLFSFFINLAIYFRAGIAILSRFIKRILLPVLDFSVLMISLYYLKKLWSLEQINFPIEVIKYALPSYILTWLITNFYAGSYDFPIKVKSFFKGTFVGTIIILVVYALLPKDLQFSRLFILISALIVLVYFLLSRTALHYLIGQKFDLRGVKNKNFAVVGETDEIERVKMILKNTPQKVNKIFSVSPYKHKSEEDSGAINQLDQIIDIYKIDEVIFCAKNTSAETIIHWMSKTSASSIEFKIAQPNSTYLIGSNSIDTAGDLYLMEIDNISSTANRRNKRTFDFISAFILLLCAPLSIWFYSDKVQFLKNTWHVFIGKKTWIGYALAAEQNHRSLPRLKQGILTPAEEMKEKGDRSTFSKLNLIYARNYSILTDLKIISKFWRNLDR
ncbi:glycosyl transferase family 2 [Brumimicrobium salinarum]|uniref:Glycosyl transferase family 2 n=1 Tax=Brumimicrobium salinarum TaxID=2058658 RepID=A0A2I0R1E0_9FLAO|nr:glycosyltransferase [Brumimicrobium salinarum]PKR80386.1 glycosyl transferase family 2 [Brumimicrobium salinarum]